MSLTYTVHSDSRPKLLEQLAQHGIPEGSCRIYKGRNSLYAIPDPEGDGRLNIKDFHRPSFPNNIVYTNLRLSKARRSFENATRLLEMGFLTPEPIGWAEVKSGIRLTRSYYVSQQLEDVDTVRDWERFPDCDRLLHALAGLMARLFETGVWHKDFSPGNILFRRRGEEYEFYLVDVNRMEFDIKSRAKLMGFFRCITLQPDQTRRLARHYAEVTGQNPETIEREAIAQLEKYQAEKARHRLLKRFTRREKKK